MNDFPEALGDLVTAGAAARAAEPEAGKVMAGPDGHTQETACLNCGTALDGPYCGQCGQHAHVHRTLGAFFHDLLHGVLHFEGKFWRTLPLLAWQPGRLTRAYIDGKRASYISPIALFLFTVFISFALFNASGGFGDVRPSVDPASKAQIEANLKQASAELAALEEQRAERSGKGEDTASLERQISDAQSSVKLLNGLMQLESNPASIVKLRPPATAEKPPTVVTTGGTQSNQQVAQWLKNVLAQIEENPGLLLYKFQTNSYKLSWMLIPISVPFVWLLFPFSRKFRMYDHTVFVTYSISFMTMLLVVASIGGAFDYAPIVAAAMLYAPFHLYRALRGTYGLSGMGAIWRMALLSAGCFTSLAIFIVTMFGLVISE